jgi:hypothetical protein
MQPRPKVSFLMPYRWLTEDKIYLAENIKRQFLKDWGADHTWELEGIPVYRVNVVCRANKPIKEEISKTIVQKALKPLFPIAKCLRVDSEFTQHKSKTMLPVLEFQVFF